MWLGSGVAVAGRPAAEDLIRPLALETPYATGAALKKKKIAMRNTSHGSEWPSSKTLQVREGVEKQEPSYTLLVVM